MVKIDYEKNDDKGCNVYIDDILAGEVLGSVPEPSDWLYLNEEFCEKLNRYSIQDLSSFYLVEIPLYPNGDWILAASTQILLNDRNLKVPTLRVYVQPNLDHWTFPFSIITFVKKFKSNTHGGNFSFWTEDENSPFNGFGGDFIIISGKIDLHQFILESIKHLQVTFEETMKQLFEEISPEAVISIFNFPEEFKVSCQQYLVYFIQFLKDLGIEAYSEFDEHINGLMFKVVPKNKEDALNDIRIALNCYLDLPSYPNVESFPIENSDISVQQLSANVFHLKSQLMFAQSTIQMKDSIIENMTIASYRRKEIVQSLSEKNEDENRISLFEGVIKITDFESKKYGIKIKTPQILRYLKRAFLPLNNVTK